MNIQYCSRMIVAPLLLQIPYVFSCNFSSNMFPIHVSRQRVNKNVYEFFFHPAACVVNHMMDPVQQDSPKVQLVITVSYWLLTSLIPAEKLH